MLSYHCKNLNLSRFFIIIFGSQYHGFNATSEFCPYMTLCTSVHVPCQPDHGVSYHKLKLANVDL